MPSNPREAPAWLVLGAAALAGVVIAVAIYLSLGDGEVVDLGVNTVVVALFAGLWHYNRRPLIPTLAYAAAVWTLIVIVPHLVPIQDREIATDLGLLIGLLFSLVERLAQRWISLFGSSE